MYLTYSRCLMELNEVIEILRGIIQVRTNKVKEYMLVREEHEDGGYHVHVYLEMLKRFDSEDPKRLDLKYKENDGVRFHGKYEVAKNKSKI